MPSTQVNHFLTNQMKTKTQHSIFFIWEKYWPSMCIFLDCESALVLVGTEIKTAIRRADQSAAFACQVAVGEARTLDISTRGPARFRPEYSLAT